MSEAIVESDTKNATRNQELLDIEDLHQKAVMHKSNTYTDPKTGFTVFTEYAHLKRGKCCGNMCRHCPYGWEKVQYRDENGKLLRKIPRVRCGDKKGVEKLLGKIDTGEYFAKKEYYDTEDEDATDDESVQEGETCSSSSESPSETCNSECGEPKGCRNSFIHPEETKETSSKSKNTPENLPQSKSGGRHGGKYTNKNVPYTRTGDSGTSVLLTGERRSKDDDAFEAMGTVDELCSFVGVVHAELVNCADASEEYQELEDWLLDVMSRLFDIGSHVAKPRKVVEDEECSEFRADGVGNGFNIDHVHLLEEWIDHMTDELPELTSFILPTGSKVSAQLHVARTVCRRAERVVSPLVRAGVCDPNAAKYLNRLSDFFFTAARWSNFCDGLDEVQYRKPIRGSNQRNRFKVNLRDGRKEK